MASGNAILAGILGGLGGAGQAIGGGFAQAQKDQLEREKLAQERDLRQQVIDAQIQQQAQQQRQFDVTQAATERDKYVQPSDLAMLYQQLGMKAPVLDAMGPSSARIPASLVPAILTQAAEAQKVARETDLNSRTAAFLQQAKGTPDLPGRAPMEAEALYDPGAPAIAGRAPLSKWDTAAGLTGLGHKDAAITSLMNMLYPANKFAPLPADSPGLYDPESGAVMPIDRPGALTGPPPETPGVRYLQTVDKNGRTSWTPQAISVGADREGEAAARGYRSFAEAPTPVQREINAALDTQGLRRAQQQGVEAAKLNAKPLTEDEAKSLAASTAALGAVGEINRFSPEQIGKYVGVLNKPLAEAQQILAGATGGAADENFIAFKMANARLQATMFDIAGKAVTETEKKVVTSYIPTGDEPNAAAYLAKLRGFEAYTRAARDTKLELTRTGRGAVTPADYDQRLLEALGKGRRDGLPASAPPSAPRAPAAGPNQLSRQDPLYSNARGRGMTDQQIQSKYGITLVP